MGCAAFTGLGVFVAHFSKSNNWVVRASVVLAAIFYFVASFLAWRDEYRRAELEVKRNSLPEFRIYILGAFWDERQIIDTPDQRIYVCVYLGVCNVRDRAAVLKRATLSIVVDGQRYTGKSDEAIRNFGSIRHSTNFRWKGDRETPHGIYTPIISLSSLIHSGNLLKNGALEEGSMIFTFQGDEIPPIPSEDPDLKASSGRLLFTDSLDGEHESTTGQLILPHGTFLKAAGGLGQEGN